jgi:HD-like signal output (HDOD) protein
MQPPITLQTLLQQDSELSSLPEIFIRVSELLDDEDSSATQIGRVVETDPSLSSRILKMVNSAFYGFPQSIASISQAISILGRDRIRQILIGAVLGGVFGNMKNKVFFMEDYWQQSVKTAILSRLLGLQSTLDEQAEVLFTAGLLHQIGRLILVQKLPEQSMQVQQLIENFDADLAQAEQQILGFTHCDVGAAFIRLWGLPEILAQTAAHYKEPAKAEQFEQEARLVNLANRISFLLAEVTDEELDYALDDIAGWELTGLDKQQIMQCCQTADEQVYQVMESLGMVQMKIDLDED